MNGSPCSGNLCTRKNISNRGMPVGQSVVKNKEDIMKPIEVQGLTKDYGEGKGIFDLNFSVSKGEIFGFLGPNGAGKTTTIRHLMGFIRPDSGTARIVGLDCFEKHAVIQTKLGYLPGEIALMEEMTGTAYLNFMADLKKIQNKKRIQELSDYFELNPKGSIRKMSKGTKQKIAIICAFMQDPDILLLDEPTSGLDPLMQNRFIDLILEAKKNGTTILLSSHIFEEVERTCDRTAIIKNGKLMTVEDMNSLAQKKKKIYTVTFRDIEAARRFAAEDRLPLMEIKDNKVSLSVSGAPGAILEKIASAAPVDLEIKSQSLEELFLHFYDKEEA